MQSHSTTITCYILTTLALTPKGHTFYIKIHIKCYFVKLQTHSLEDLLFIGLDIFPQVIVICLHLIEHASLGFKIY